MSLQALREQRAAKAKSLHERVNNGKPWTEEDQTYYDNTLQEIDDLDAQIDRINTANARAAQDVIDSNVIIAAERIGKDAKSKDAAIFAKWLRGGDNALSAEDRAHIQATMSTTTPAEGGYTVATEVANTVLDALKAFGGVRAYADVFRTTQGNPMQWPTSDGTTEEGEIVAENQSATDEDVDFSTKDLPVYKYSSKVVTVPWELLQDSNVDIEGFVRGRLVTRLGRITNKHFTTGTGVSQPNGFITAAAVGKTGLAGQTGTVIYDDLVDLEHSVDPAYRNNTRFVMHDDSVKIIRKIKDAEGRPIFVPGYEQGNPGGAPATLLGRPLDINQHMATMAANAKSIAYGDFSFYKIRDVMAISMFRFTDSAYTKKGQVGFLAWMRSGGNLIDVGGAIKLYQNPAA